MALAFLVALAMPAGRAQAPASEGEEAATPTR
jgi:hypothetical protein